jgi:hypothetical protein
MGELVEYGKTGILPELSSDLVDLRSVGIAFPIRLPFHAVCYQQLQHQSA